MPMENTEMFDVSQWTPVLDQLAAEAAKLSEHHLVHSQGISGEEIISAPEACDTVTDAYEGPILPISELAKQGLIADPTKFSEAEVIDTMDVLLDYLTQFLEGKALGATVLSSFFTQKPELLNDHSILLPFVKAILKIVDRAMFAIQVGMVRDGEEEFSMLTFDVDLVRSATAADVVVDLDAALANAGAATKPRLAFVRYFLAALEAATRLELPVAHSQIAKAQAALRDVKRDNEAQEPSLNPKTFCEAASKLLATAVSTKPAPLKWTVVVSYLQRLLSEMDVAISWPAKIRSLTTLMREVRRFAATSPTLLARSVALRVAMDPANGKLLVSNKSLHDAVLDTLADECGCPLPRDLVRQPMPKKKAPQHRALPGAEYNREREAQCIGAVRRASVVIGHAAFVIVNALLHNRGRAHRKLMNCIESELITAIREVSEIEEHCFSVSARHLMVSERAGKPPTHRGAAMTALVTDITLDAVDDVVGLATELNLLTIPELPAAVFVRQYVAMARADNYDALFFLQGGDASPKNAAPMLATRTQATLPKECVLTVDVARGLASSCFIALSVLRRAKTDVPALHPPVAALQTVELMFMHRFRCLSHMFRPRMMPFSEIMKQSDLLMVDPEALRRARSGYLDVVRRLKDISGTRFDAAGEEFVAEALSLAKHNAVALGLLDAARSKSSSGGGSPFEAFQISVDTSSPAGPKFVVAPRA